MPTLGLVSMHRFFNERILLKTRQAGEWIADVDHIVFDKTGTITMGMRKAITFIPLFGVPMEKFVHAAAMASYFDKTGEGRSIVDLAKSEYNWIELDDCLLHTAIPFTTEQRYGGAMLNENIMIKGADIALFSFLADRNNVHVYNPPSDFNVKSDQVSMQGGTPLALVENHMLLGIIHLRDDIKPDMRSKIDVLQNAGIKVHLVTGDNPLTADAIARSVGITSVIARATIEMKLAFIKKLQHRGHRVAVFGGKEKDCPLLQTADVGVALHRGVHAVKEAAHIIDFDSNPVKLVRMIALGKKMIATQGAFLIFGLVSGCIKYLTLIYVLFHKTTYAETLNVLKFSSPKNALLATLSATIVSLLLLAIKSISGVYLPSLSQNQVCMRIVTMYGIGGGVAYLLTLKCIDYLLVRW
jgi:K+-transporting ATPase ATPase B chain